MSHSSHWASVTAAPPSANQNPLFLPVYPRIPTSARKNRVLGVDKAHGPNAPFVERAHSGRGSRRPLYLERPAMLPCPRPGRQRAPEADRSEVNLRWPGDVVRLAETVYQGDDAAFALADALLKAGTPNRGSICGRSPQGCWMVDAIAGLEVGRLQSGPWPMPLATMSPVLLHGYREAALLPPAPQESNPPFAALPLDGDALPSVLRSELPGLLVDIDLGASAASYFASTVFTALSLSPARSTIRRAGEFDAVGGWEPFLFMSPP